MRADYDIYRETFTAIVFIILHLEFSLLLAWNKCLFIETLDRTRVFLNQQRRTASNKAMEELRRSCLFSDFPNFEVPQPNTLFLHPNDHYWEITWHLYNNLLINNIDRQ